VRSRVAWEQGKRQGKHWKWRLRRRHYVANPPKNLITYAKNSLPKRSREFVGVKQEENRETKGAEQGIRVGHPPGYKVHRARRVHWLRFAEQQPPVGVHAQLRAVGGFSSAKRALILFVLSFAEPYAWAAPVFVYEFHPSAL
jgi:hypothetical protein